MSGRILALRVPNDVAAIADAAEEIARHCRRLRVPEAAVGHLNLALDEAMTNTIAYAWPEGGAHEMSLTVAIDGGMIMAEISDDGIAFDPLRVPPPDLESDLESRPVGGLGVHFMKTLMDEVAYRREGERNILTIRKRLGPEAAKP